MFIKKNLYANIVIFFQKYNRFITIIISVLFLFVLIFSIINVQTGQKMIPFDELKDRAYANEPKDFNFKPLYANDSKLFKKTKLYFMETYPIIYSLTPLTLLFIFYIAIRSFSRKIKPQSLHIYFSVTTFFLLYFLLTIFARIITNVRYSIVVYPLIAILVTVAIYEISQHFTFKTKRFYAITSIILIVIGMFTLWTLKPFYFSYANPLLPSEYSIHDSWGHGSYEAAQYLNSLPNATNLTIWSNSKTVCAFFNGNCLRSRKIDLTKTTPDYFVISKRGELKERNHFILLNAPTNYKLSDYYFKNLHQNSVWEILINNRKDNFITIIPFEK
jgi:hypothetical protein